MKEIYCDICKKSYKINYYYTHKNKSKKNKKKLKKINNSLLETDDNIDKIRGIKTLLNEIKDKIDSFLINI